MVNCSNGSEKFEFSDLSDDAMMNYAEEMEDHVSWSKVGLCNAFQNDNECQFPDLSWDQKENLKMIEKFASNLMSKLITDALLVSCKITWSIPCSQICHMSDSSMLQESPSSHWSGLRLCWTPELLQGNRHSSRSSLSSRLSSSHNSLITPRMDESGFITSAVSHEVLSSSQSSDVYNVPLDSENYAVPIDVRSDNPKPPTRTKKRQSYPTGKVPVAYKGRKLSSQMNAQSRRIDSRGASSTSEPIHLTLHEVRQYMHDLYANSTESSEARHRTLKNPFRSIHNNNNNINVANNNTKTNENYNNNILINNNNCLSKNRKNAFNLKNRKTKECDDSNGMFKKSSRSSFSMSFKQTLCNIFRFRRLPSPEQCLGRREPVQGDDFGVRLSGHVDRSPITKPPFSKRALPPLPGLEESHGDIIVTDSTPLPSPEDLPALPPRAKHSSEEKTAIDFASSIEKVKDYGWYWGPISGESAEKILSNEPDGSFIVRDSSDDYYIFSLTFKLNSVIRHVRIEHDQGKFSFGSSHRFKSNTIVDFIESAVEHSRSGRYLFFLHRRPVLGPMRVQLLHPVSRFKQVQSLQHMCRFVILKFVRKDLIKDLPLPRRVLDYLNKQHYYSENLPEEEESDSSLQEDLKHLIRQDGNCS